MKKAEIVWNLLESSGTTWKVEKEPLKDEKGRKTESFGLFRKDNDTWLGTVGKSYHVLQNWETAELVVEAAEDLLIEMDALSGKCFNGGKFVSYQMRLPDKKIGGVSNLKRYITAINSHDGTMSVGFGSFNEVVACKNQFYRAMKGMDRVRHGASMKERLRVFVKNMQMALAHEEKLMERYEKMAQTPADAEVIHRVMDRLFGIEDVMNKTKDVIGARKFNQAIEVGESLDEELGRCGSTMWGLFNGFTHYLNHKAGKNKDGYMVIGGGKQKAQMCFDEVVAWIEEREAVLV